MFPKRLNLLKIFNPTKDSHHFAGFILSDLRGSNSNLTLFLISSLLCFDLSLPVTPSLFPSSAMVVFAS